MTHMAMLRRRIFLSRNITDEKMREMDYQKKLEKSVEQAEQANIAKTDFLRRMSHDIRTPINGIRGMVDICRYYIGNPKKRRSVWIRFCFHPPF